MRSPWVICLSVSGIPAMLRGLIVRILPSDSPQRSHHIFLCWTVFCYCDPSVLASQQGTYPFTTMHFLHWMDFHHLDLTNCQAHFILSTRLGNVFTAAC